MQDIVWYTFPSSLINTCWHPKQNSCVVRFIESLPLWSFFYGISRILSVYSIMDCKLQVILNLAALSSVTKRFICPPFQICVIYLSIRSSEWINLRVYCSLL